MGAVMGLYMSYAGLLLKALRNGRGVTQRELARRTKIDVSHISRVEKGMVGLSYESVNRIRVALSLNQQEAEQLVSLANPRGRLSEMQAFRGESDLVRRSRVELAIDTSAQLLMQEYAVSFNPIMEPPVPFRAIAEEVLGLRIREVSNLAKGIDAELYVADKEILLAKGQPATRKAFSCCHELGHWVLHRSQLEHACRVNEIENTPMVDVDLPDAVRFEIQANMFASALLMPSQLLVSAVNGRELSDSNELLRLARAFEVSLESLEIRLARLGLLRT